MSFFMSTPIKISIPIYNKKSEIYLSSKYKKSKCMC